MNTLTLGSIICDDVETSQNCEIKDCIVSRGHHFSQDGGKVGSIQFSSSRISIFHGFLVSQFPGNSQFTPLIHGFFTNYKEQDLNSDPSSIDWETALLSQHGSKSNAEECSAGNAEKCSGNGKKCSSDSTKPCSENNAGKCSASSTKQAKQNSESNKKRAEFAKKYTAMLNNTQRCNTQ